MSVWLLRGDEIHHVAGISEFGSPPVLSPPSWALAERVWQATGCLAVVDSGRDRILEEAAAALAAAIPPATRRIALVVPDTTRVGPWRRFLPAVLEATSRRGIPFQDRCLLVAGGVHPVHPLEIVRRHILDEGSISSNMLEEWRIIQNGDNEFQSHREVGMTTAGTVVALRPEYLEADWRVLLGEVSYHYFAGYGGGRKLIFPGLGTPEGIIANHRRALGLPSGGRRAPAPQRLDEITWNAECAPGRLEANPVHQDLEEAAALAPPNWSATVVERPPRDPDPAVPRPFPVEVVQGPYPVALTEAALLYDQDRRVSFTVRPDLLLIDAGGEPRDATFLQAHKSLQHAGAFAAPGGAVLLVARCREGLGSETLSRYAQDPSGFRPSGGAATEAASALHLQTLIALRRVTGELRVALWSDLPPETVRSLGLHPIGSLGQALDWCRASRPRYWGWLPRTERFLPAAGWLGEDTVGAIRRRGSGGGERSEAP